MEENFVDYELKPKINWGTGPIVEKARYYDSLASSERSMNTTEPRGKTLQSTLVDLEKRRKNRNDFAYISSQANLPET